MLIGSLFLTGKPRKGRGYKYIRGWEEQTMYRE